MATTKIITEVTDLNAASSTNGLKMPTGGAYSGTPTDGMLRNDTTGSSQSSASTMQHYNGTEWKNFENLPSPITVDFLVVGGGGGGGDSALGNNGGGGAGGYKTTTTYSGSETPLGASLGTAYTVEVGPGGAINLNGTESKFGVVSSEIISSGGGKGGIAISPCDGGNGASGGGGATLNPTPAGSGGTAMPSGQGNNGGAASGSPSFSGGGGGGAGAVGGSANSAGPGNGGAGTSNNITGTNTPYAGGGGGGSGDGFTSGQGTGGLGGGGIGVEYDTQRVATNGAPNTGGGGGGGIFRQGIYSAKSGGSGIVILRYPTVDVSSYEVTGTLDTLADTVFPTTNVAVYKLDGNATDVTGNYNGNFVNAAYGVGKFGQAGVFNGSNNYMTIGNPVASNIYSFSIWIKPTVALPSGIGAIIGGSGTALTYYQNQTGSILIYNGGSYLQATNFFQDTNWVHLVAVSNGSNILIYRNGALFATLGASITLNSITFGKHPQYGVEYFNGSLDQIRIFNTVLSAGDATSLYNEGVVVESTDGADSILQFMGGTGTVKFS